MLLRALLVMLFASLILNANDKNWTHWRGPLLNGSAPVATNLPSTLKPSTALWRFELPGPAPSTPIVFDNQIYLTTTKDQAILLFAIDTNGNKLWQQKLGDGNKDIRQGESNAAAPSPITDGNHVWSFTGTGLLHCFDRTGKLIWQRDIQADYGAFSMYWGMATSPLLHEDRLYLQLMHDNSQMLLALNAKSGKEHWQYTRKTDARMENLHSYTSPVLLNGLNGTQILVHGADYISGHGLQDGQELWRSGGLQDPANYNNYLRFVATPAVLGNYLIVPSAKNGPVLAFKTSDLSGDMTTKTSWKMDRDTPDVPSPTGTNEYTYLCRENGIALCLETKTGKVLYKERAYNYRHRSSPLLADGKVYLAAMDGTITVLKAGGKFEILSQSSLKEPISASIIYAGRRLYVRSTKALYAFK